MNLVIEQLTAKLSSLYKQYGYAPYTMSKFEEYGLYLRNKDFLISDRVLTFTDTDGKLMALKPDVTLSIIKNTADHLVGIRKVYYRENVYRPGNAMQGFREILQVGLECMGNIDDYCILETLRLAVKSLLAISDRCVLDISHMGLVTNLLDRAGLTGKVRQQVLDAIGSKNTHELQKICEACDAPWEELVQIAKLSGKPQEVLPQLEEIMGQIPEILQFKKLLAALDATGCSDYINVDFSVIFNEKQFL